MSRSLWGCSGTVQITTSWNLSYWENVSLTLGLFRYSIDHNQLEPQLLGECLAHSGAVQVQYRSQPVGTSAIGRMSHSLWGCSGTVQITTSWNLSYWENVSLTLGLFRYSIDHNQLEPQLLGECLAHSGAVQVQYRSQPVGTSAIRRMSRSLWGCSGTVQITTSWNLSYQENVSLTLGLFRYSIDHNQLEPQLLGECLAHSGAVQVQYRSQPVGTSAIGRMSRSLWGCSGTVQITTSWNLSYWENVSLTLGLFRYSIDHNQLEPQLLGECLAHSGAVQVQYRSQPVGTSAIRRMSCSLWGCSGTIQITTSWNLSYWENVSLTLGLFRYSIDHNQLEPQLLGECLAHSGAVQVQYRSQPVGTSAIRRMSRSLWGYSGTVYITTSWNLSYQENVSLTLGLFRYSIDHNQLEPQLLGECLAHSGAIQVQYRSQPVGTSAIRRMSRSLWGCSGTVQITTSWNLSYQENVSLTLGLFRYSIDHNQLEPQLLGECLAHSGAVQVQYRSQPVGTSAIGRMSHSLWGCSGTVQITTSWNLSYQENVSHTLGLFRYSIDDNQLEPQLLGECFAHSGAVQVQYRSQPVGTSAIGRMSLSLWGCSGTVQITTSWNLSYQENVSLTLGLFRYSIDHNQLEPQLLGECLAHSGAVQVQYRSQPDGTSAIRRMSLSLWGCSGTEQITTSWNLSYWENVSLTLGLFRYSIDHNQLEPQLLGECLTHSGAVQVQYRSQPVGTSAIRRMSHSLWGCSGTVQITTSWNLSYQENVSLTLGLFRYSIDHNQLEPQLLGECLAHSGAVQVQYRSQPVGTSAIGRMSLSLWGCSGTEQITTSWNLSYQENVALTLGQFRYSIDHNQLEPQLLGECLAHSGTVQVQYKSQPVGTSAIRRIQITTSWNLSY